MSSASGEKVKTFFVGDVGVKDGEGDGLGLRLGDLSSFTLRSCEMVTTLACTQQAHAIGVEGTETVQAYQQMDN